MSEARADEPIGSLGQLILPVSDLGAAIEFCSRAFGLEPLFRDGDDYAALDAGDGRKIGLACPADHPPGSGVAFTFKVADLDAACERVEAAGASPREERIESAHERRQAFTDPSGNSFYLYQPR